MLSSCAAIPLTSVSCPTASSQRPHHIKSLTRPGLLVARDGLLSGNALSSGGVRTSGPLPRRKRLHTRLGRHLDRADRSLTSNRRVVVTFLEGRLPRDAVTAGIFALQASALLVLIQARSPLGVLVFVLPFGAASGAVTLARATAVADFYGPDHYGSIGGGVGVFRAA